MSNGFSIDDGRLVIDYNGRRVATTGGTLLQFLAAAQTFTTSISFPDANKVQLYTWQGSIQRAASPTRYNAIRSAQSWVGARPQEWTDTVILGSAPAGADLFIGQAKLVRTNAPSHTWVGQTISPVIPQNVAIQLTGSMLIEMAPGLCRSMTVDIVGGDLVAILEHSVGPAAGNFTTYGAVPVQAPSSSIPPNNVNIGIENVAPSGAAFPAYHNANAPNFINESQEYTGALAEFSAVAFADDGRYGKPHAATYSDPTDYTSTYSLVVNGRFGRRS